MKNRKNPLARRVKLLFLRLGRLNDSPQRIALGFGLGVFLGILPGAGPIAALVLSALLRLNKVSALFGALATNTWLSFTTFLLSIKTGAAIMGMDWQLLRQRCQELVRPFSFAKLAAVSARDIIVPVAIGYLAVSLLIGAGAYAIAWVIVTRIHYAKNKNRAHLSRQA